jgi:hypothetical protein
VNISSSMTCLLHGSLAVTVSNICSKRLEVNAGYENLTANFTSETSTGNET